MEGRHSVAGPWFAVHQVSDDWKTLDEIWISNGRTTSRARVQARVSWQSSSPEAYSSYRDQENDS
jgi:hypothetical protein